jgi:hypothetical protein
MAQQYLNNQNYNLIRANNNIVSDITMLSNLPINSEKTTIAYGDINNDATALNTSTKALGVLQRNAAQFAPSDITTFSSNLTSANANLAQLETCYSTALTGVPCVPGSGGTTTNVSGTPTETASTSSTTSQTTTPARGDTTPAPTQAPVIPTPPPAPVQETPFIDPRSIATEQTLFTAGNREFFSMNNIYGGMPIIEGLTQNDNFAIEKTIIGDLNVFNQKYARYLKCNDTWNNFDCDSSEICIGRGVEINTTSCTPLKDIKNLADKISTDISILKNSPLRNGVTSGGNYNAGSSALLTPSQYETKYQSILQKHANIIGLRNDLDNKMTMLNNPGKSISADYKKSFDATIYSGILITALATSGLYYVFNHL